MKGNNFFTILFLIFIFIVLTALDLGLNILGIFIPGLGGTVETLSEAMIELIQIVLVVTIAYISQKK